MLRVVLIGVAIALSGLVAFSSCRDNNRLEEVRKLQAEQRFEDSIEPLRAHLDAHPDDAEALYLLGFALVNTGHASEAVWSLQKAAVSDRKNIEARILLASAYFQTGNFEEATQAAESAIEIDPHNQTASRIVARSAERLGQNETALAVADQLLSEVPNDREALGLRANALTALDRKDEAEATIRSLKTLQERDENPAVAAQGCLLLARYFHIHLKDSDRASAEVEKCLERFPTSPAVLQIATTLADEKKEPERATVLWRSAVEQAPEDLMLRSVLAERLERDGEIEEARSLLKAGADRLDSAVAWQLLADFLYRHEDTEGAEAAMRKASAKSDSVSPVTQMIHAEMLVDLGKMDEARQLVEQLDDPRLGKLLDARILASEGAYADALAAFDAGLPAWPNNAGARLLAGYTAESIGDFDRALSEYRAAFRSGRGQTAAALAAARLYYATGKYREAVEFGQMYAASKREDAWMGTLMVARALTALERYEAARTVLQSSSTDETSALPILIEQANVERNAAGAHAAAQILEQSDIDLLATENAAGLRVLVSALLADGRSAEALQWIDRAAARREAEDAALHDLRGRVLIAQNQNAAGKRELERALAIDSSYTPALGGLATLAARQGDLDKAIALFDRAASADPNDAESRYNAAQLERQRGDSADAEARLRKLVRDAPGHAAACNDLAWTLADRGEELDLALDLAERAALLDPGANTLDTLGWVRLRRGEYEAAGIALAQATTLEPDEPAIRYRLGRALEARGDLRGAADAYRKALETPAFPEAPAARRQLANLESKPRNGVSEAR